MFRSNNRSFWWLYFFDFVVNILRPAVTTGTYCNINVICGYQNAAYSSPQGREYGERPLSSIVHKRNAYRWTKHLQKAQDQRRVVFIYWGF